MISWPGEAANTHQLLHIPQADQGICTSCGKILASGIEFNADAVGRMSINGLYELEIRVTGTERETWHLISHYKITQMFCSAHQQPITTTDKHTLIYWYSRCRLSGRTCHCHYSRRSHWPQTWTAPQHVDGASWHQWTLQHRPCCLQQWSDHQDSNICWYSPLKDVRQYPTDK